MTLEILNLAARAPSGHNTQPWTLRVVANNRWILGIAAKRRLPAVDPMARETLLSLGTFLESLVIAAMHFGHSIQYETIAQSPLDSEVLELRLGKIAAAPQQLDQLKMRRTVRNGLLPGQIKTGDLKFTLDGLERIEYFSTGSAAAKYLAEGTVEANKIQAWREPAEVELSNWIRWSEKEIAARRNGLTPASMEIDGLAGWYVSHFYNRASVMTKAFREKSINQVKERVDQGGGWLVLSSGDNSITDLIETGRCAQRMWLRLRERKLAIHPMTQMLEEEPWRENVAKTLGTGGVPQFLFRLGYLNSYPLPASRRMPAEWILT